MSICLGNLPYEVTEARLNFLLAEYGSVKQIYLSLERSLAVVEMVTAVQEQTAIENLDGRQWYGHSLAVNQSKPYVPIQMTFQSKHICPCCSSTLLRHIGLGSIHWRCSHCRQEMPIL